MRVDAFLLADAATVAEGKLYVHGGGITRINAVSLPVSVQITLTVRLVMDDHELEEPHRFSCLVTDPDGSFLLPPAIIEATGGARAEEKIEGEENYLQITLGMGMIFPRAGVYRIAFKAGDETLREMTLPVVALSPQQLERALQQSQPRNPPPANRAERRRQDRSRR